MTTRTGVPGVFALAAVLVAIAGVAVHPLLHGGTHAHSQRAAVATAVRAPDAAAVDEAAVDAAIRALGCESTSAAASTADRRGSLWCGRYTVTRRQTTCSRSGDLCTVDLLGTLTSRAATTVIALTVLVVGRDGGGWRVTAVRS